VVIRQISAIAMITARAVPALPAHHRHATQSSVTLQDFADPLPQNVPGSTSLYGYCFAYALPRPLLLVRAPEAPPAWLCAIALTPENKVTKAAVVAAKINLIERRVPDMMIPPSLADLQARVTVDEPGSSTWSRECCVETGNYPPLYGQSVT